MPACKDQGYYFQQPAMEGRQGGRGGRLVTKFATREWTMGGLACGHVEHREASGSSATSKVLRKGYFPLVLFKVFAPLHPQGM